MIGTFPKRGLYGALIVIPVLMAAIALALIPFGAAVGGAAALLCLCPYAMSLHRRTTFWVLKVCFSS